MKEFLSREQVSYEEKNVGVDRQAAQEMVNLTGQMGVPVTVLAGDTIIGFNQPALRNAVNKLRQQQAGSSTAPKIKLGAQVADAVKVLAQQGQPARPGALLGSVRPGSLAEQAGLQEGDLIVTLDGHAINSATDLANALESVATRGLSRPALTFWRNGQKLEGVLPIR